MKQGYIRLQRDLLSVPEVADMYAEEGAAGLGLYVAINLYLSHCEGGWGVYNGKRLSAIAIEARRHRSDVKRIVEDYGLFTIEDTRFTSFWMQQQYAKDASKLRQRCATPARPYSTCADELQEELKKENKEKAGSVCPEDTRPPESSPATPERIGPSAYETIDREGLRRGNHGEPVPWWAPPQTDIRLVWSLTADCWRPVSDIDRHAERQRRQTMQKCDFMMKTAYETLAVHEQERIQDNAKRQ